MRARRMNRDCFSTWKINYHNYVDFFCTLKVPHLVVILPFWVKRASWVPRSMILPLSRTMISSALLAVETSMCKHQRLFVLGIRLKPMNALVAWSNKTTSGSLIMQLARPTRCLCPPLNFILLSPTSVSNFSGNPSAKDSSSAAARTAAHILHQLYLPFHT